MNSEDGYKVTLEDKLLEMIVRKISKGTYSSDAYRLAHEKLDELIEHLADEALNL